MTMGGSWRCRPEVQVISKDKLGESFPSVTSPSGTYVPQKNMSALCGQQLSCEPMGITKLQIVVDHTQKPFEADANIEDIYHTTKTLFQRAVRTKAVASFMFFIVSSHT